MEADVDQDGQDPKEASAIDEILEETGRSCGIVVLNLGLPQSVNRFRRERRALRVSSDLGEDVDDASNEPGTENEIEHGIKNLHQGVWLTC